MSKTKISVEDLNSLTDKEWTIIVTWIEDPDKSIILDNIL